MKKAYINYVMYLVLGLITYYVLLSVFNFNVFFINIFDFEYYYSVDSITDFNSQQMSNIILNFVLPGIVSLLYGVIAKRKIEKNVKEEIKLEDRRKFRKIFMRVNFFSYFLVTTTFFIFNWHYLEQTNFRDVAGIENFPWIIIAITAFVQNLLAHIPTNLIIFRVFNTKEEKKRKFIKNEKIIRIISNILTLIKKIILYTCFIILSLLDIAYYINIPEFEYVYGIYLGEDMEELGVELTKGYQDIRKNISAKKFVVPKKIWGMEVKSFYGLDNLNLEQMILPNTMDFDSFNLSSFLGFECKELIMDGEPIEWYVKDNVIYNIEETEMFVTNFFNQQHLYIPEKIISWNESEMYDKYKKVEVSENNPYYFEYGNVIWNKDEYHIISTGESYAKDDFEKYITFGTISYKNADITISPDAKGKLCLFWEANTITIPKELENEITNIIIPVKNPKEYIVEEGNKLYSTYDGNLYNKDMTKLIALREFKPGDIIQLPNTLEGFLNETVAYDLLSALKFKGISCKINPLRDMEGLVLENNQLFQKEKKRILMSIGKKYELDENVLEVDENVFYYETEFELKVDNNNPKFSEFEGNLYNKDKTELLAIFNEDKIVILPKELKLIKEGALERLMYCSIKIEEGNETFEINEGKIQKKDTKNVLENNNEL